MGQIFQRAEKYLEQFDPAEIGWFVEIGTSRKGDDGSTKVIAGWANRFNKKLYTVDIDPKNVDFVTKLEIPNVRTWLGSGEKFLDSWPEHLGQISVLYLDNFDWDWHPLNTEPWVQNQIDRYHSLGQIMNNVNCQAAHLQQAITAAKLMASKSLIICDDTWFVPGWGVWCGKSGAAVPYLVSQGYQVLEHEEYPVYGAILGKGIEWKL